MIKVISVVCAALLTVFCYLSLNVKSYKDIAADIRHPYAESITPQEGASRSTLSESEQQLYDKIKTSLKAYEYQILVRRTGYDDATLRKVIWCVMQDSPDIFWVDWKSWEITDIKMGQSGFTLAATPLFTNDVIDGKKTELENKVGELVALAAEKGCTTDYDKALFFHDYLAENCAYTLEGPLDIHSAYGALIDAQAVCDGYALAYKLLLNKSGVECLYVEGTTAENTTDFGHAWNIVKVDGVYCQVDVTWDDIEPEVPEGWSYTVPFSYCYFLLSDSEMYIDHVQDNPVALPECPGYGYFEKLGLKGDTFSGIEDNVVQTLYDNIQRGRYFVEYTITDPDEYQNVRNSYEYAIGDVIEAVNEKLEYAGSSIQLDTEYTNYYSQQFGRIVSVFTPE